MRTNTQKRTYFDCLLENAKMYLSRFSEKEQDKLKEELEHGAGYLNTVEQLMMYAKTYGEIHRAKLIQCYEHIPLKVWHESKLSIIDYGAGQGLAEIVLADFMKSEMIDKEMVRDITIIEPSRINLTQSINYLSDIFGGSELIPIQKKDIELTRDDIQPKSDVVLNILSNVIDLENFNGNDIITLLNEDKEHNNILICVNPYYQENGRGRKMKEFCDKLQGYRCVYKFQKHLDEWDENYSCQIQILVSSYY